MSYDTFYFENFEFEGGQLSLRYSLDEKLHFEEVWQFPITKPEILSSPKLTEALRGLWIMCGISYYKSHLPKNIIIKGEQISKSQAEFFEKTYLHGLGEFFYTNKIDPNGLIEFPYEERRSDRTTGQRSNRTTEQLNLSGTMIPIGGGKDSLTTLEILKEHSTPHSPLSTSHLPLSTWSVGHSEIFQPMLKKIGLPHLQVERKIAPTLIEENKKGALNGHVPISAILAFASVVTALLNGKKYIALSNESSANEGNIEMYGMSINHQYSKTLEFEQDFQNYVAENISQEVHYFSFLRPLKEIQIAQIFCSKCFDSYQTDFSSCNQNFKITQHNTSLRWCGKCPKCAFVACIFAPFLDRDQMYQLFGCEIFEQPEILGFIPELLGRTEHKPFECVGEYDEVQYAINQAVDTGNWEELQPFVKAVELDLKNLSPHSMPQKFWGVLQSFLSQNLDK